MLSGSSFLLSGNHMVRESMQWTSMSHLFYTLYNSTRSIKKFYHDSEALGSKLHIFHDCLTIPGRDLTTKRTKYRKMTSAPGSHVRVLINIF